MNATTVDVQNKLKQYIVETFLYDEPTNALTADYPLFESRIIDSMGIFQLIDFIEEAFNVSVEAGHHGKWWRRL